MKMSITKKIAFLVALVFLSSVVCAQNKKIAVLDPVCRDGSVNSFYMNTIRGVLEKVVSSTDEYQAYNRIDLDQIMDEHDFQRSGAVSDSEIKELGEMASVDYIMVSDVSASDDYLSVVVKILNIETGEYDKVSSPKVMKMEPEEVNKGCSLLAREMFNISDLDSGRRWGTLQLEEGRYEGEFINGKPHGEGTLFFNANDTSNRASYNGSWLSGMRNGEGTMIYGEGDYRLKYVGNWMNNKKRGEGKMFFVSGARYEGNWDNDKRNGRGTFYYVDGSIYEGNWKDDKCHGRGIMLYADGNKYEGSWKNDERDGRGILYYHTDDQHNRVSYDGNWTNGKKEGHGVMTWKGGVRYDGEWKNDKMDGQGTYYYMVNGVMIKAEGNWEDGKQQGKFIINGSGRYEGYYVNGKKDGEWIRNVEGKKEKAKFQNGALIRDWH